MKRNFGTVGAIAFAFIFGFLPLDSGSNQGNPNITAAGSPNILRNDDYNHQKIQIPAAPNPRSKLT
jgi:hypothetical protein